MPAFIVYGLFLFCSFCGNVGWIAVCWGSNVQGQSNYLDRPKTRKWISSKHASTCISGEIWKKREKSKIIEQKRRAASTGTTIISVGLKSPVIKPEKEKSRRSEAWHSVPFCRASNVSCGSDGGLYPLIMWKLCSAQVTITCESDGGPNPLIIVKCDVARPFDLVPAAEQVHAGISLK